MTGMSALNHHCSVLKVHLLFGKEKSCDLFLSKVFICKPSAIFGVSSMKASCVKPIEKKITGDLEQ